MITSTDRDWEAWGKKNPYFGVISSTRFLAENLDDKSLRDFFESGERQVEHVYDTIRAKISSDFHPNHVLDYGCGVGRLVISFAKNAKEVIGIDVSHGMLKEATENCKKFGADSVRLLHVDDMGSLTNASFDFVHSSLVLQHIPTTRGERILQKLIDLIVPGGVGAVDFPYSGPRSEIKQKALHVARRYTPIHGVLNLVKHRPFFSPIMEGHIYSFNRLFNILSNAHFSNVHVEFDPKTSDEFPRLAMLYFQKASK
jgi:ubiquinone/menaquinone biosynthesis C-methylase UbiE